MVVNFSSKDVLMRVVAQNLSPELTLVEKVSSWDLWFSIPKVVEFCIHPRHTVSATILIQVMTAHPDCATLDTTILDALHIMHDGKFLHIPVLDGGKLWFFQPKVASFDTSIVYLIFLFPWTDGRVAACLDVLQITHAAISMVSLSMAHALHLLIHPSNLSPSEMFFPPEGWRRSWCCKWCGKHDNAEILGLCTCSRASRWGFW